MTARDDLDRQLDAFLRDGPIELPERSLYAVRDLTQSTRQRVVIGPWRLPDMNKLVPLGLAAAAVVVALIIGTQFLGPAPGGDVGAPTASPSPTAEPTDAAPSPAGSGGLPVGSFQIADVPIAVTADIPSSGWVVMPGLDALSKADDSLDPPRSTGAAFLAWSFTDPIVVYGDPCQWSTTTPKTPATTADAIATALVSQQSIDATAPEDVTIGGYTGKHLTLHVPDGNETREESFKDCDQGIFGFYGVVGGSEPQRNAQGPAQIDELWILDVEGSIVILDAAYGPAVPQVLVDEMRAMAASATFQVP